MRSAGILLLVAAVALPAVAATPVQGELVVGGIRFDAPAAGRLQLHALYANDTSGVARFELVASTVELRVWRSEGVEVGLAPMPVVVRPTVDEEVHVLTDVRIALTGVDHAGWLGVRWSPDAEAATLAPGSAVAFRASSDLGLPGTAPDTRDPDKPYFRETLADPHLLVEGATGLSLRGSGQVRLAGLDLDIDARENRTRLHTGTERPDGPAGSNVAVWANLNFMDGTVHVEGLGGAQAQAIDATLAWSGPARLRDVEGGLHDGDRAWLPQAPDALISGDFEARLAPVPDGVRVDLTGDLAGGTLAAMTRAPAPADALVDVLPWALVGLGIAAGGGLTYVALRGRAASRTPTPEDLLDLALQAAEADDPERALGWIRRARKEAPDNERLALEEATMLESAGHDDAAVSAYRALAERSTNGEACWLLARALARRGAHPDDVAPWLVQALQRDPHLAFEVEDDELLAPHVRKPAVRAAIADARGRL
ncbi:MAG TPA: hypothetical protein VNX21_03090 [Candidatus Thermoplasmatota archaeon]|nr:hypothetical protein [Candidatus Thermoplasmatota archaeon]